MTRILKPTRHAIDRPAEALEIRGQISISLLPDRQPGLTETQEHMNGLHGVLEDGDRHGGLIDREGRERHGRHSR